MHLVSISIENYRSIAKARKIGVERSTVLVGPNNEGKSNVLRALVTAMRILTRERFQSRLALARRGSTSRRFYEWERDYPLHLQEKRPNGESAITLEFELTEEEIQDFKREIGSNLNGTLPLKIAIGNEGHTVTVVKRGRGATTLSKKSPRIAAFVADRVHFEHIPAVRTATSARNIVGNLVARELETVESDPEYEAALGKIAEIQQPVLEKLSETIKGTLTSFLPDVTEVRVSIPDEERSRALRRACKIVVNDGTPTDLALKGDGVQSLAALAIMRHASETSAKGRNIVIAIEEPESHLHPSAIHGLREVLDELSDKHQVVISTHNPLFVDRVNVGSNILVNQNQARPARAVAEIRDILGVRASDNLRNAELVLVVEGEDDRVAITALLSANSTKIAKALQEGTTALDTLHGSTNLSYKLGLLRQALCLYHCFLDDDAAGHSAFERARSQALVTAADVNFATVPGLEQAELEDLYDPAFYAELVKNLYRVSLETPQFKKNKKWSERMRDVFKNQGKLWDDRAAADLKAKIAEAVRLDPSSALHEERRASFNGLVSTLEARLDDLKDARG
jgi:energy-coupling factor transporter ATP-binding protein EcfA2